MSKEMLRKLIGEFTPEGLVRFLRAKNPKLRFPMESIDFINLNGTFTNGIKLAGGELEDGSFVACSFYVKKELTERSSKKAQYEVGKKILKLQ